MEAWKGRTGGGKGLKEKNTEEKKGEKGQEI